MAIIDDYNEKIEEIRAIPDDQVIQQINIPVPVYAQEAENLYNWALQDKKELKNIGLNMALYEDIPKRTGALRHAEALWIGRQSDKKDAAKKWSEQSPPAFKFQSDLLQQLRFAYRNNDIVLSRVNAIAGNMTIANLFQSLHEFSVLGKSNTAELKNINFDMSLLDKATAMADELSELFASAKAEDDTSQEKIDRDKAYTFLKWAVDEVCSCGQHINRHNPNRKKGYTSSHLRRVRNRYKKNKKKEHSEEE